MGKTYTSFEAFDAESGFSEKAGFKLKPLQVADVEQFATWSVSLNAYEVGGGKTVVSTAASLMSGVDLTLVLVPPILVRPWVRWLLQVSGNIVHYQGTAADRKHWVSLFARARWVVMSHAVFRKDFAQFVTAVRRRGKYEIIVDEAHALKNVESVLFKDVENLARGQRLQMLTGTPTSKPLDAYAYISLKTPDAYRSLGHFKMLHVTDYNFFKAAKAYQDLDVVADRLAVQTVVRTKKDIHGYDNAPLYPDTRYELSKSHYKLYEKLVNERLLELPDGNIIDAATAQRLYHAMQQVVVNFDYFSGDPRNKSASYDLLDTTIEQTDCLSKSRSKLIVWTYYKRTTASVLDYLKQEGVNAVAAYGGADSQASFDKFMLEDSVRVLVAQPQSAGAGLNPQEVCSEMLLLETSTVSLHNTQLCGRVDRVGQKRKPVIRFGVAEGTIQVALLEAFLNNDDLVSKVERSRTAFRDILFGGSLTGKK